MAVLIKTGNTSNALTSNWLESSGALCHANSISMCPHQKDYKSHRPFVQVLISYL